MTSADELKEALRKMDEACPCVPSEGCCSGGEEPCVHWAGGNDVPFKVRGCNWPGHAAARNLARKAARNAREREAREGEADMWGAWSFISQQGEWWWLVPELILCAPHHALEQDGAPSSMKETKRMSADELRKALADAKKAIESIDAIYRKGWKTIGKQAAKTAVINLARKAAEWGYNEGSALGGGDYYQWKKELDAILGNRHE